MNSREGFIGPPLRLLLVLAAPAAFTAFARAAFGRRGAARRVGNIHLRSVAQAVAALDDDQLSGREAGLDRHAVAFGHAHAHLAQLDRPVLLDDVDESSLP